MTTHVENILKRLGIEAHRRGREWYAKCPNPEHEDNDPSWRIRDDPGGHRDGYHRCWPCGFEGGLIHLVSTILKVPYYKAREWIESDAIAPPPPIAVNLVIHGSRRFRLPEGVELGPFEKWPSVVRRYVKKRHITPEQVERWGLGYAVEGKLEGRIVIPTRDRHGHVFNYTARTFVDHPKRYREPDAREKANRGVLFGEQHWPDKRGVVVVLEGSLNGLAVERARPDVSIAALAGSNLPPSAGVKLTTFTDVIIATDPDPAGDKIADQLGWILDRQEIRNHRMRPPEGEDADSLDREELAEMIESAVWALR